MRLWHFAKMRINRRWASFERYFFDYAHVAVDCANDAVINNSWFIPTTLTRSLEHGGHHPTWKVYGTEDSRVNAALLLCCCCCRCCLLLLPAAVPAADPFHVLGFCYSVVACGEQRPLCLSRLGKVFSAGLVSLSCRLLSTEARELTFAGSIATDCHSWNF